MPVPIISLSRYRKDPAIHKKPGQSEASLSCTPNTYRSPICWHTLSTYVTDTHMAHMYHADASTHTIYTPPIQTHYTYILHILLHSSHTHHTYMPNTSPLTSHICYRYTHILPYMSHISPRYHILHTNSLYTYHTYTYKHTEHVTSNRSSQEPIRSHFTSLCTSPSRRTLSECLEGLLTSTHRQK